MNNRDYIENCIRALPPEEQSSAREAFAAIGENGDGTIGKLLVVMRANNAYAKTIPNELKTVADTLLRGMEAARIGDATQRSAEEQRREKQLRQIVADQIPVLAKSLSVTRLAEGIETQNVALDGLEHSVSSLRHLRVGGVLFLMALAAVLGAGAMGGLFYTSYENGRQAVANWDFFSARGIHFHAHETDIAVIVTVEGPEIIADGTGLKKDDQDRTIGANLAFSK